MPHLKQLTCSIELTPTNTKLEEYGTTYGDGHVSTYIAVPTHQRTFNIHLTSDGYIAPGLAMFVYIDGAYQCNRNRRGLLEPGEGVPNEGSQVEFRVRQKEERQADGGFVGRDWSFHALNTGASVSMIVTEMTRADGSSLCR